MEQWFNFNLYTYLLLPPEFDARELERKFPALIDKYMGETLKTLGGEMAFFLQPLTSIHLHSNMENEISGNSSIVYIYIFGAVALFILLIACINFMNLATARSASRAKEVGVRKVIGAERGELIKQFLGESLLHSLFSLIIALGLAHASLPFFRSISGREIGINYTETAWLIPGLIGMVLFVGFAAGSYPALFLSRFRPANVLKGSLRTGAASSRFRSILVVTQFVISISLIIGTSIILNQLKYMKNKSLGFKKENILVVRISDERIQKAIDSVKEEFKKVPGVIGVGASSGIPGNNISVSPYVPEGFSVEQTQLMEGLHIDHEYIPSMGIEIAAGRNFSLDYETDKQEAIIINETAVKRFGWDNPIGKKIEYFSGEELSQRTAKIVVGVIKDIHMASLHTAIMPLYISNESDEIDKLSLRLTPSTTASTLERLQTKWAEINPNRPLDYFFLEDSFGRQYRAEERLSSIFVSFSVFAIFIACLGLFGMASFMAEQKTKEIGIRKVLGASTQGVVVLLSKNFLKLVIISNVIAWPVIYFAMHKWLENFAYRAGIKPLTFILAGLLAVAVTLATVSYQSIKAALSNPVDALKFE
jgi:putative ABC transport system permease protein